MSGPLRERVRETLGQLRRELLQERTEEGHWCGELSPSALSTATAVSALSALVLHGKESEDRSLRPYIERGVHYLREAQNEDGGFGDTDRSHSNIATSYLVLAAATLAQREVGRSLDESQVEALRRYIDSAGAIDGLRARYGKDKTFVVPILTNLAIAELVPWSDVPALPFEAAVFPQSMYRMLQMPVVSYAIPALVAIGQTRHFRGPRAFFPLRWMRAASIGRTMKVLRRMQPDSGGYLEATPLTSFVVMSLAVTGRGDHAVSQSGQQFLIESMQADGSWPIDTNLATWVTSLAMHALANDPDDDGSWCSEALIDWHLGCQHLQRHPFTGASPGGWGWSDLSGAVPDSDDTPAAMLALCSARRWMQPQQVERSRGAIARGAGWLCQLQNRDGGWPTFCRGWGKLPFDRSSTDLTAHALRALSSQSERPIPSSGMAKATEFLVRSQQPDGSWLPLWFGNQDREDESNPVYGTSRVLLASTMGLLPEQATERGCAYLLSVQNDDGGWGGGPSVASWIRGTFGGDDAAGESVISSVEETALAVDALVSVLLDRRLRGPDDPFPDEVLRNLATGRGVESGPNVPRNAVPVGLADDHATNLMSPAEGAGGGNEAYGVAIIRGIEFLLGSVDDERHRVPWPIGFYFAKLWYHERLYPLIFTTTALAKYLRVTAEQLDPDGPR